MDKKLCYIKMTTFNYREKCKKKYIKLVQFYTRQKQNYRYKYFQDLNDNTVSERFT